MMTWAYFIKFVFLIYILFFSKKNMTSSSRRNKMSTYFYNSSVKL